MADDAAEERKRLSLLDAHYTEECPECGAVVFDWWDECRDCGGTGTMQSTLFE